MERVLAVALVGVAVVASCNPRGLVDSPDALADAAPGGGDVLPGKTPDEAGAAEVAGDRDGHGDGAAGVPDAAADTADDNPQAIPGLIALRINPASAAVEMGLDSLNRIAPSMASFQVIGTFDDGSERDVSAQVQWPSAVSALSVVAGQATVTAPGRYDVTARSGSIQATATLLASFAGSFTGDGFDPNQMPLLDGAPQAAATIVYPLDGALLPKNLGPLTVQIARSSAAATASARLEFTATAVDIRWYARCVSDPVQAPGPGCYVQLPLELTQLFVPTSENEDVTLTARVAAGGAVAESPSIHVAFADVPLAGALYYWSTIQPGPIYPGYVLPPATTSGTAVLRYQLGAASLTPELIYTDQGAPPAFAGSPYARASDGGQGTCVGCHAVSADGRFMAVTVNGSDAAGFALLDIANKSLVPVSPASTTQPLQRLVRESCAGNPALGCATETSFGPVTTAAPAGAMVNMYKSRLYLRTTDFASTITNQSEVVPSAADPYRTDPAWSAAGDLLAFTGFASPSVGIYNTTGLNGDEKVGGQIWVASAAGTAVHDDASVVVPREAGVTSFFPAISADDALLVFDKSTCGATDPNKGASDYGNGSCDGYDDWTAALWLTTPRGGPQTRLDRANGAVPAANSWPRWSPSTGTFRGRKLYWLAFSSRRPYGMQVNYSVTPLSTKPQLWIAGVLGGGAAGSDPSFAPAWLPNQNPNQSLPSGNHTPQWVPVAVPLAP